MKTVLTLLALVVAVHSQCNVPQYTQSLVHSCTTSNSRIKMPYYQNVTQYYICSNSVSVLASCPSSAPYFSYVLQNCCTCDDYIPAVPCSNLALPTKPSCVSISDSTSTTTPKPTTTPKSITTTSSVPTPPLSSTTTPSTPTSGPPGPGTDATPPGPPGPGTGATPPGPPGPGTGTDSTPPGTGTSVAGPPSPPTDNPNLVTPPTPMPTPPNIPDQPPFVNNPPVTG